MKQGWETKRLDDLCEVEYGTRVVNKRDGGTVYPVYGGGGATFFMDTSNREDCLVIARFAMSEQCTRFVKGKFFLNDSGLTIKPKNPNEILQRFLDLQIIYLNDYIYSLARGTAQKNLDVPAFRNVEINYPKSLSEQKEIVAILDKVFADIAKAKENAEQNLKNAKELFESYLQSVFSNKGDGWEESKLGDVCDVVGGGTPSKKNNSFYNGDIYWATVRDMKGEIIKNTEHKITTEGVKNSSTNIIPKRNVIIATRVGLGKICMIENDTAINQDLRGVIPMNNKKLSVDFLYRWFKSIAHKIVEEGTGATVQGVKLPFIKSLIIYYPSLKKQEEVIKKLDNLSLETKKLESIYQQKINDLEELKKSILQKAFNGELKSVKV